MELLKLQNKLTPTFITKQIGTLSFFTMRILFKWKIGCRFQPKLNKKAIKNYLSILVLAKQILVGRNEDPLSKEKIVCQKSKIDKKNIFVPTFVSSNIARRGKGEGVLLPQAD